MVSLALPLTLVAIAGIGGHSDGLLLRRSLHPGTKEVYESRWTIDPVLVLSVQPDTYSLRSGVTRYELELGPMSRAADSIRISLSAPTEQVERNPRDLAVDPNSATGRMDVRGQIVLDRRETRGLLAAQGDGPMLPLPALPVGRVRPGDEWTFFVQNDRFTGDRAQFGTARLVRVEDGPKGKRARVHYQITVNADADLTNPDVKDAHQRPFEVRLTGPLDYVGSAWIDVATGLVTSAEVTGIHTLYVDLPSIKSRSGTTGRSHIQIRRLESDVTRK